MARKTRWSATSRIKATAATAAPTSPPRRGNMSSILHLLEAKSPRAPTQSAWERVSSHQGQGMGEGDPRRGKKKDGHDLS